MDFMNVEPVVRPTQVCRISHSRTGNAFHKRILKLLFFGTHFSKHWFEYYLCNF